MGFSKAMSSGWISIDKTAEGGPRVYRKDAGREVEDRVGEVCRRVGEMRLDDVSEQDVTDCKKRKLIAEM